MTIRTWLAFGAPVALAIGSAHFEGAASAAASRRPGGQGQAPGAHPRNVVFILLDDLRYDGMGFLQPEVKTPNIDRLARGGAYFPNTLVTSSLCSPSRATILTGQRTRNHRVVDNNNSSEEGLVFFPRYLQQAGYQTAFFGKWHMGESSDEPRTGFDRWVSFLGQGEYFPREGLTLNVDGHRVPQKGYITDELSDYAMEWLQKQRDPRKPFFLYLSHKAVHTDPLPAPRHAHQYDETVFRIPASAANTEENYRGKPMWVYNQRNTWHGVDFAYHTDMKMSEYLKGYYATLSAVDDGVGRLLDYLRQSGLEQDTMVVFTSDNGFLIGDHGLIDKRNAYEGSIRVPMVVWAPGLVPAGVTNPGRIRNLDIAPTVLDLAHVARPPQFEGQSALPLMTGEVAAKDWRPGDFVYEYYWEWNFPMTPTTFAIERDRLKYIQYHGVYDLEELYDLAADPDEMHNLIDDASRLQDKIALRKALFDELGDAQGRHAVPFTERSSRGVVRRDRGGTGAAPFPDAWLVEPNRKDRFNDMFPDSEAKLKAEQGGKPPGGTGGQPASPAPGSCPGLAPLELKEAKVLSAEAVPAGAFTPPPSLNPWMAADPSSYKKLPAFCRVVVKATPSADSDIRIEVWMPAAGWNGRFRGQGNGGFAGEIDYRSMGAAVAKGYATAGTDTGHSGGATDASWALGHPEKVTDFAYRAIHAMTRIGKAVARAFHGKDPQRSYFASCSNGGRQALMEAQRFPEDYDGILAGAPANDWTHLLTKALADAQATTLEAASYIPARKLPAIAKAVNAVCDARDGVTDGVLDDPRECRFDPATLRCREGDLDSCLTAPQAAALEKLYEGPRDSRGREIFPGDLPGAEEGEEGWGPWITGPAPGKSLLFAFGTGFFTNMVYEKAGWDYRSANVDEALKAAEAKTAEKLDATNPDLSAFRARGGKLILYHGWNDPAIPGQSTVRYYESVVSRLGRPETEAFVRLYMVPGMQHCGGGPGPCSFGQFGLASSDEPGRNVTTALERWVETGEAPSAILATKYVDDDPAKGVQSTRPLCPYPQAARYKGQADPRVHKAFACEPASR